MTAEALRRAKDVTRNVFRLVDDAKLLCENERYSSDFALAVLALEEVGKLLFILWGVPEPRRTGTSSSSGRWARCSCRSGSTRSLGVTRRWTRN